MKHFLRTTWTRLFPNPGFYGWAIVGLCFLASALSSPGQSFAISLYIDSIITSLDVSRLQVSSLYGAMTLLAALFLPFVGSLADRISGRRFLTWNLVFLALAIAFFGTAQNLVMLAMAFFLLRLLGQGAIGLGTLTIIVLWFRRYRGRALAIGGLGYAFGELVFPATILGLIAWIGWRPSLWVIATVYLLIFVPIFFFFMRRRRDDEPVDGGPTPCKSTNTADSLTSSMAPQSSPGQELDEPSLALKEALKMPLFWGLLIAVSILPLVVTALIFHQLAIFDSVGWGAERVPLSFIFFALFSVGASYLTGIILEGVPSRFGITFGMLVAAAAIGVAAWGGPPLWGSLLYGALLGAAAGVLTSANSLIWPDYYGIEALGAIKGVVNGVRNGATAIGPPLVAWLMGPDEIMTSSFAVLAAMCIAAALLAWFMTPPKLQTPPRAGH